ncbi:ribosomal L29e protein family-domain-containing protein [Chytriomyces sp. MP71]|nr:ribosomal L29e protein family-domain-containing protein [Chytriomyces sp. MP71]
MSMPLLALSIAAATAIARIARLWIQILRILGSNLIVHVENCDGESVAGFWQTTHPSTGVIRTDLDKCHHLWITYNLLIEILAGGIGAAKSKNHTNHNQNKKAHKNGIKKPKSNKYPSLKGVDPKFIRNQRFAKKGTQAALKQ